MIRVLKIMRREKLLGLGLFAVLALFICSPISAQAAQQEQMKAEKFIEIAHQADDQAVKLMELAETNGVNTTAANTLIGEGEALLALATTNFDGGNYTAAFEDAREAQAKFRDAIQTLDGSLSEDEAEQGRGLLVAISQAEERIQRLRDVLEGVTATSQNQEYIDWVNGNLTAAEQNLADAKAAIENQPATVSVAANLHAAANKNIEEAFKALKLFGDWTVAWRSESYLNGINNKLDSVKKRLDSAEKQGVNVTDLRAQLTEVEASIQDARAKLLAGDKNLALVEIKEARDALNDIMKGISQVKIQDKNKNLRHAVELQLVMGL